MNMAFLLKSKPNGFFCVFYLIWSFTLKYIERKVGAVDEI